MYLDCKAEVGLDWVDGLNHNVKLDLILVFQINIPVVIRCVYIFVRFMATLLLILHQFSNIEFLG